jgi:hypothetical protein
MPVEQFFVLIRFEQREKLAELSSDWLRETPQCQRFSSHLYEPEALDD